MNDEQYTMGIVMVYCVDLLSTSLRGRELKGRLHIQRLRGHISSTSLRGRELKDRDRRYRSELVWSTSLRGRELKDRQVQHDRGSGSRRPP